MGNWSQRDEPESFPSTRWADLEALRGPPIPEHRDLLNSLVLRYWKPVYSYVIRRGFRDQAADLTQDFFVYLLERRLFVRADQSRGRFRAFLVTCLEHYLIDAVRRQRSRRVLEGIVSVGQLCADDPLIVEPTEAETPEAAFYRAWVWTLLLRAWTALQGELQKASHAIHGELFRLRVLDPILHGTPAPALSDLAARFGLDVKQVANRIVTVTRAFQRVLREEIRFHAASEEEVEEEIQDLFRFASAPSSTMPGRREGFFPPARQ